MKTLMVAALAVAAIGANVAFAEEDDGIVSAAPTIADPVNPQPGMTCTAYCYGRTNGEGNWTQTISALEKAPSVKTYIDKGTAFTRSGVDKSIKTNIVKWEGFLKCKRSTTYAFTLTSEFNGRSCGHYYTFVVNGTEVVKCGERQISKNVQLKVGWNKIVVYYECENVNYKLDVKYRPNGSTSDSRPLTPGMLFHDEKPEEDW